MTAPFPNPETRWHAERKAPPVDRTAVEARIGRVEVPITPLSGGLANQTLRIGASRVMRLYLRDPASLPKEAALLRHPWRTFETPQILDAGEDYLLMNYVEHTPLLAAREHGAAAARALAEIGERAYESSGFLDQSLDLAEPLPGFFEAVAAHAEKLATNATRHQPMFAAAAARLRASTHLADHPLSRPVLLHGDFKASNLFWSASGRLLVLDWEFAFAGPVWMSLAQLARWGLPPAFAEGFETTFAEAYAPLPADWRSIAAAHDLGNFIGLLENSPAGSRREQDVVAWLERALA
ncbi:MAG: aminoglycoside phosphotransferase family protein [Pseudomonadota bacterium]